MRKIRIFIKADGKTLAERELAVGAGKTASATFEGLPEIPQLYQPRSTFAMRCPWTTAALRSRRCRASSRSLRLRPCLKRVASLRAIPGVSVDVIAPTDYEKSERTGYGLEIFQFASPNTLPRNPALFTLPPENSPLVQLGAPLSSVSVTNWRESHVLTRYINFSLLHLPYARPLTPQVPGKLSWKRIKEPWSLLTSAKASAI